MKAQFFNKPLNFTLNLTGDDWEQGARLSGDLAITNTTDQTIDMSSLGVHLCYCQTKKLKAKDSTGIKLIKSIQLAKEQNQLDFEFLLDPNCPITDNTGSLQILTGNIAEPFSCGMLELKVFPIAVVRSFIEVFELFFRFKFKGLKNKKNFIETQISPPATKEWAKIQKMNLQMKMEGESLTVISIITIKSLSFDLSLHKTKDEKKEIILNISKKDHTLHGAVNQEGIKKHIADMLEQLKLKPIL